MKYYDPQSRTLYPTLFHAAAAESARQSATRKTAFVNRRFIVGCDPIVQPGVASLPMATVLNTKTNTLTVSYPTAANVFKVAGGGENYVHGGSSPQEMIVPVLDVRMEKGRMETTTVQLTLVSILKKITNLITAHSVADWLVLHKVQRGDQVRDLLQNAHQRQLHSSGLHAAFLHPHVQHRHDHLLRAGAAVDVVLAAARHLEHIGRCRVGHRQRVRLGVQHRGHRQAGDTGLHNGVSVHNKAAVHKRRFSTALCRAHSAAAA